ncbi:MAG: DUF3179 domain-containing protein [Anaerolineae bacterium]|jgi:hypothetical protein|nr:DUF3179 domain-containing protein [Anaerolineae bacterium]MBT7072840.1 DUF3179 domain-containing protein [Anaerolineae bacterium]MBT7324070.1 DUF3179 domain-containing protein [Anaerolineae bacterium]
MFSLRWIVILLALSLGLAACTSAASPTESPAEPNLPEPAPVVEASPAPQAELLSPDESPPSGAASQFATDFSKHSVSYGDILSGGPPKDGIPAIDAPSYVSIEDANEWINDVEPIIVVEVDGEARAYPLQVLTWHEIVNDELNGKPLVVSFCPLCNTAIAFEREFDGQILDFGTTGRLRYSNLIMYDRQTETWWQQATGDGIAGDYTGEQLTFYPAALISWADFKSQYPAGDVLSKDTGFNRSYGRNPYAGYDDINQTPFLFDGVYIDKLPAMARVLTVELNGETVAYPYETLEEMGAINDEVGGEEIVVFWTKGTASALDTAVIEAGQDVGAAVAYSRQGRTFIAKDGVIYDDATSSTWSIFGEAISGELKGETLTPVVSVNHFWFSWAAFKPETMIYQP